MKLKTNPPSIFPTKSVIFNWIKVTLNDGQIKLKVQDLGTGVVYCRLMNHYFPHSINANRLNTNPRNEYEYIMNLKMLQNALMLHKINIPFDSNRISQLKFSQNWALINSLYKQLVSDNYEISTNNENDEIRSVNCTQTKYINNKRMIEPVIQNSQIINPNNKQHQQNQQNIPMILTNTQLNMSFPPNSIYQHFQLKDSQPAYNLNNFSHIMANNQNQNMKNIHNQNQSSLTAFSNYSALLNQNNNIHNLNMASIGNYTSFMHPNHLQQQKILQIPSTQLNPISINQNNNKLIMDSQSKCFSVGKLPNRQSLYSFQQGKYSVNSHIIQNNYNAIIDRVKQILLKASHDIEKIRQIKMLFNIPLNEQIVVKVEEQDDNMIIHHMVKNSLDKHLSNKQNKKIEKYQKDINISLISQTLPTSTQNLEENIQKNNIQMSGKKVNFHEQFKDKERIPQSSGKKIKNNFFGQGLAFRK